MRLKCPLRPRHLERALPHPTPTSWVLVAYGGSPVGGAWGRGEPSVYPCTFSPCLSRGKCFLFNSAFII